MNSTIIASKPIERYTRNNYEVDVVKSVYPMKDYSGEVTSRREINKYYTEVCIDNAVIVTTLSGKTLKKITDGDSFEKVKDYWKEKKTEHFCSTRNLLACTGIALVVTVVAIVALVVILGTGGWAALAALAAVDLHTSAGVVLMLYGIGLPSSIALGGLIMWSVSSVVWGKWEHNGYRKAKEQIEQWCDSTILVDKICSLRKKVDDERFDFAFKYDLKGTVVHPEEIKELWNNDMEEYFRKFHDLPVSIAHQAKLIHQFMTEGPLSKTRFEYAFGSDPSDSEYLSYKTFENLKREYQKSSMNKQTKKMNLDGKPHTLHAHYLKSIINLFKEYKKPQPSAPLVGE